MNAVLKDVPVQLVMVQYRVLLGNVHMVKEINTFIVNYLNKLLPCFAVLGYALRLLAVAPRWQEAFHSACHTVCWSLDGAAEVKTKRGWHSFISAAQFLLLLYVITVPITLYAAFCRVRHEFIACLQERWLLPRGFLSHLLSFLLGPFQKHTRHVFANSQTNVNKHFILPPIPLFLYLSFFISLFSFHPWCKTSDQLAKN